MDDGTTNAHYLCGTTALFELNVSPSTMIHHYMDICMLTAFTFPLRGCYWPLMRGQVNEYVYTCDSCQRYKKSSDFSAVLLHPHQFCPWTKGKLWVSNFAIRLPLAESGHCAVLVMLSCDYISVLKTSGLVWEQRELPDFSYTVSVHSEHRCLFVETEIPSSTHHIK